MASPVLYTDATIITVNSSKTVILNGSILVEGSRITSVSSGQPNELPEGTRIVSLAGRIVIPGLVNTHAHLAQSILRGLAEDLPLHNWLCDRIWPLEACYASDDGYVAARLTIAEMLKSGTTCFLEAMLTHRSGFDNVARALGEMGIRGCLGKLVKFTETNASLKLTDPRDKDLDSMTVDSLISTHEKYHGRYNNRLHVWGAAGTPRGSPLSSHSTIGEACKKHDIGLTMHCGEAPRDLTIYHEMYDCSPVQFCDQASLTSPKTVLAHMVHLDLDVDLPLLRESGTTVSHNPASNLKLASGIAKVPEMLAAGVNVALGTDGAPCNNTYDMFREIHLASILHRGTTYDATAVGSYKALEMATINGARALGLEKEIGSLEPGKKADFVVLDPSGVRTAPWDVTEVLDGGIDPVTVVVGTLTGRDVDMVVVDGEVLVKGGKLTGVDEENLVQEAKRAVKGIRQRSGVSAGREDGLSFV